METIRMGHIGFAAWDLKDLTWMEACRTNLNFRNQPTLASSSGLPRFYEISKSLLARLLNDTRPFVQCRAA